MIGYPTLVLPNLQRQPFSCLVSEKTKHRPPTDEAAKPGLFKRLRDGLSRTRHNLSDGLTDLVRSSKSIDDGLLEEIETRLLVADVGIEATREIIDWPHRADRAWPAQGWRSTDVRPAQPHACDSRTSSQPLVIPDGIIPT